MPIKGLTDARPRLQHLGTIRKGAPKTSNRPGRDLDHFRIDTQYPEIERLFYEIYGADPKRIVIQTIYPTPEENFDAWMEEYTKERFVRRCDGEMIHLECQSDLTISDTLRPCQRASGCGCKQVGRLECLIAGMAKLGTFTVVTTSKHDIITLTSQLRANFAFMNVLNRTLAGVPMVLSRMEREVSCRFEEIKDKKPTGNFIRKRQGKSLLTLEIHPHAVPKMLEASKERVLDFSLPAPSVQNRIAQASSGQPIPIWAGNQPLPPEQEAAQVLYEKPEPNPSDGRGPQMLNKAVLSQGECLDLQAALEEAGLTKDGIGNLFFAFGVGSWDEVTLDDRAVFLRVVRNTFAIEQLNAGTFDRGLPETAEEAATLFG